MTTKQFTQKAKNVCQLLALALTETGDSLGTDRDDIETNLERIYGAADILQELADRVVEEE